MNPVSASVNAPRTPQVNLLPPEIEARRSAVRTRNWLLLIAAMFMVLVAGVYVFAAFERKGAEDDLAAAQQATSEKQTQLAAFSYLPVLEAEVNNSRMARAWAGATDVAWADQLSALLAVLPDQVRLETLIAAPVTPLGPVASDGSVFGLQDLGSLTFSGQSDAPIDTAALQDAINAVPGFERAWVEGVELSSVDETDTVFWSYTGTVRITSNALSGRTETSQEIQPIDPETGLPVADSEG